MLLQCLLGISQKDIIYGSSYQSFCKKDVFKNFAKFTGKCLCQSLFLHENPGLPQTCNFKKKRLWHRCFPVNFAKFLRTPFFTEQLQWLLLSITHHRLCLFVFQGKFPKMVQNQLCGAVLQNSQHPALLCKKDNITRVSGIL